MNEIRKPRTIDLKKQYVIDTFIEKDITTARFAINLFLDGQHSLRQLVKYLKYTFPPEEIVFFEPEEAELRSRATAVIIAFLRGEMPQDEFLDRLGEFLEDDNGEN